MRHLRLNAKMPGMQRRRAWTLIELVMVIVLLAIVGVVSFAAIGSYRSQYLRAAAGKIANDLSYAKNLAQTSSTWHGVSFNLTPVNTYSLYETDGSTDTAIKSPQDPDQNYGVDVENDYSGVLISNVDISAGSKVEFDPYGMPYDDKTGSALTADGIITLSIAGSTLTVRIAAGTGRIYIQ